MMFRFRLFLERYLLEEALPDLNHLYCAPLTSPSPPVEIHLTNLFEDLNFQVAHEWAQFFQFRTNFYRDWTYLNELQLPVCSFRTLL